MPSEKDHRGNLVEMPENHKITQLAELFDINIAVLSDLAYPKEPLGEMQFGQWLRRFFHVGMKEMPDLMPNAISYYAGDNPAEIIYNWYENIIPGHVLGLTNGPSAEYYLIPLVELDQMPDIILRAEGL